MVKARAGGQEGHTSPAVHVVIRAWVHWRCSLVREKKAASQNLTNGMSPFKTLLWAILS